MQSRDESVHSANDVATDPAAACFPYCLTEGHERHIADFVSTHNDAWSFDDMSFLKCSKCLERESPRFRKQ